MKYRFVKKIIFCFLFILLIFCLVILLFTPNLSLKGDKVLNISYNDKYKDAGYNASFWGKNYNSKVIVDGEVNTKKIGKYIITYKVGNNIFTNKVKRIVNVVDDKKPTIRLYKGDTVNVCPNKKYEELGYKAIDNYDGDITDKVVVKTTKDKIIYEVSDTSSNKTKVVRNVLYQDKEKPTITFDNGLSEYIMEGSTYENVGYKSIDNCDGDITDKVKITGSVDSTKAGKYTLKYTVSDDAGNEENVSRDVVVQSKELYTQYGCGIKGAIFLTFDDGPLDNTTITILNVLKEEDVKATFFITNNGSDDLVKREYSDGHSIGIHTASHNYSEVYSSVDNYFKDLDIVAKRIKRITGLDTKIIRFPGGSSNTISRKYSPMIMTNLTNEALNRGYKYYDWNVDSEDAGKCAGGSSSCVYEKVISNLSKEKCNMVLMHDTKSATAGALKSIIEYGKSNGYSFHKIENNTPMVKQRVNN